MKKLLPVILATAVCAGPSRARADEPGNVQILHLDLTLAHGAFSLVHFTIDSGAVEVLEPGTPEVGQIRYVVMDHSGRPMSEGVMPDPSRVQRETVDHEGNVRTETEVLDSVNVQLVLPYDLAMLQVRFTKVTGVSDSAGIQMTHTQSMGAVYVELHGEDE